MTELRQNPDLPDKSRPGSGFVLYLFSKEIPFVSSGEKRLAKGTRSKQEVSGPSRRDDHSESREVCPALLRRRLVPLYPRVPPTPAVFL